jgi:hypothetical protein
MTGPIVLDPDQGQAVAARGSVMLFKAVAAPPPPDRNAELDLTRRHGMTPA